MEHPLWNLADTSLPARVDIREGVLSVNTGRLKVVKMGRGCFDSFRPWCQRAPKWDAPKWDGAVLTRNRDEQGARCSHAACAQLLNKRGAILHAELRNKRLKSSSYCVIRHARWSTQPARARRAPPRQSKQPRPILTHLRAGARTLLAIYLTEPRRHKPRHRSRRNG